MDHRVSQRELEELVKKFSDEAKVCFTPNFCYGSYGVNIMIPNSAGCVTQFIGLGTKKETFNKLQTIREYYCESDTRFDKYKISKCIHKDSLNHYEGKKNVSVCHEITDKKNVKAYYCSACHREDISEKEFLKSEIPTTWKKLRMEIESL